MQFWLLPLAALLFSLAQLNDDRRNEEDEEEEEENNTKNFHYWRIDELAVHLSCAVLRISFSIVRHLSISESVDRAVISLSLSLAQFDGQWARICMYACLYARTIIDQ